MSFSSEYFKLRKKQLEEEEKKTDNAIKITRDYDTDTYSYLGIRGKQIEENKNKAENPTWFKESKADNFAGAASATTGDAFQHFIEGLVNIPELAVDALATIAPYFAQSMYYQNGGGYNIEADAIANKSFDALKKGSAEFVKKDLYDAEEVSKKMVANVGSAAYMYGINQSGAFATPEQVAFSQKLSQDAYKYVDEDMQKNSVLGDKSDSLISSGGQLAGTAALTAMGVPAWLTIGSTAMGGEAENALNQGATLDEAALSGVISAGAEILTEKISGGIDFGMGTLDDVLTKKIATKISNKALQTLAKFGMDVVGEGGEEVASQFISNLGSALYREENLGEILASEKALQEYLDSFIGGAVLGGVSSGGKIVNSAIKGTNVVTEHTKNEQKVFDYEFNKRVTEKENQGEKLTNKDKAQIRAEIFEDMENGNIDISDIEEALGGDSYKAYKNESDNNQKLKAEYDELAKMEGGKRTYLQDKRLAELDKMDFNDKSKIDGLKKTLSDEVFNTVKGDRGGQGSILMESYIEESKTRQAFKADYAQYKGTKYEDAAKQTIDNAMKAGANDTRKVHNIVDMAAKLSSETGVVYEFGSNESVKADFIKLQSEQIAKLEAIENPTPAQTEMLTEMKDTLKKVQNGSVKVNGNITSKGVTLNLDSHKALNRVVGHELTHTLEKTEHYKKLQDALFNYAKTKGVKVDEKIKELESLYKGVDGDARAELTADLVGDYLFNDYDFVKTLSKDRNLFQKIWDEIKYIAKIAKPGSKEARELAKVERMFQKAFEESKVEAKAQKQEADAASGDASFSLVYSKEIEEKSTNYFTKNKPAHISQEMYDAANETIREMVDYMKPYLDITNNNGKRFLPEEIIGNTIFKNGSYGKTIENTTICYRTLAYIDFTNEVKKRIGRPLTVDESFLASQMLYDIATDPQCLYCYVSLDRKAYDGFLLEYTEQMNSVIEGYNSLEVKDKQNIDSLYKDFLNGRKDTKPMKARFHMWLDVAKSNSDVITLEDLTTEEVRAKIINDGGAKAKQITDAERYAQSASWAKKLEQYRSYNSEILKMSPEIVKKLNSHYGLRFYSFSEYTPAFIAENMQQIRDASLRGLYGLGYTKETDFANVFAPTGMNINMSVFGKMVNGEVVPDTRQGANWDAVKELRNEHKNVGAVFVATNDSLVDWALNQDWIDVVIPFHIVRTGASVAEFYKWTNNTQFQADKDASGKNKTISPTEHHNDFETFKRLVEERGLTPRFDKWFDNPNYMKLVNETRLSVDESSKLVPVFNLDGAKESFDNFVGKGGYYGNWYKDGVDFDHAVDIVANDVLAGKKANDDTVDYGRQDLTDEQIAELKKRKNKPRTHGLNSLSKADDIAPVGRNDVFGKDFRVQEDIAPIGEGVNQGVNQNVDAPMENVDASVENVDNKIAESFDGVPIITTKQKIAAKIRNAETELEQKTQKHNDITEYYDREISKAQAEYDAKKNKNSKAAQKLLARIDRLTRFKADADADFQKKTNDLNKRIEKLNEDLWKNHDKADNLERFKTREDAKLEAEKGVLAEEFEQRRADLQDAVGDKDAYVSKRAGELYEEISNLKKGVRASKELGYILDHGFDWKSIKSALINAKNSPSEIVNTNSAVESTVREMLNEEYEGKLYELDELDNEYNEAVAKLEKEAAERLEKFKERIRRNDLQEKKVAEIKTRFAEEGKDFDEALEKAKRMHTFSINDNTPQRVNDKTFGYEAGEILNDMTFNKVAENETEATRWANEQVAMIRKLSKKYNIKPGSKQNAAAMMYGEGFYADDKGNLIKYGDEELAKDFPNAKEQENIKGLANDKAVREFYDKTLDAINESRVRNGYPEIPKRQNYYLHFRAMEDTFSRLGIPFNPNDIKAKDLPTDINGMTADLKPGQPYFASANKRMGNKTTYDLLGGMERYMNGAKAQIYHIDDIQNIRALRNYIADKYGQANGLENLDSLTPEEQETRIQEVFSGHLSNYAKFLNEYANHLAGKTALMDRSVEGIFGRRGIQALKTLNSQVAKNMVGFNIGSAGTNLLSMVQAAAKLKKADFIKAFAQTISNKFNKDGFVEKNGALVRRRGADKFNRTAWEKATDTGFWLMGAVDNFSSEVIVRAKYNELVEGGMESETAHKKAGEWAMRILGDRSLGQMPMQYNSAIMGIFNKFQLEVRNQLDSMVYDTVHENMASDGTNAKKATKIAKTMVELAVFQHIFGQVYESIAGYNPAFDIISTIATLFGWDDDEDDEDTFVQNLGQASEEFLGDLPYSNLITDGGRIPIMDSLPIKQLLSGKDDYGNEVSALETMGKALPYYVLPTGYGQIKKTTEGLSMFSEDIGPVTGSYTNSGNLRFPVEDTPWNRIQAGIFGQYSSANAREYFDEDYAPLNPNQTQEFADVGMSFTEYHDYREGLKKLNTLAEKFDYIDSLDLTTEQKNILINNIVDRDEPVDMTGYGNYGDYEEFDFATKNPEKYSFFKNNNISYESYAKSEESKEAYNWAYNNPEKYEVSKAIGDVMTYRTYSKDLNNLQADKDKNGNSISGSRKKKVVAYINNLNADYGAKIILYKTQYPSDDRYNKEIVEYLNGRDDISYMQMVVILTELGMKVDANGKVTWD